MLFFSSPMPSSHRTPRKFIQSPVLTMPGKLGKRKSENTSPLNLDLNSTSGSCQKIHEIVICQQDPIWIRKNGAHQLKSAARQKKSQVPNAIGHPHFAANQVTTWSKHINPATHHMISMISLISCQISFTFLHIQNCPMEGVQHQPGEQVSNRCKSSREIANRPEKARI